MKKFKKKHTKIPSQEVVLRLLGQKDPALCTKYRRQLANTPDCIPQEIRNVCLAEFDPGKRTNIRYYPDLHNFEIYDLPNRSLPVPKFLNLFRPYVDNAVLDQLEKDLTDFRLVFHKTQDEWIQVYANDEVVESCMTNTQIVKCYAHPENKLALAALYAPGGNVLVARTIVNTDEKWYIRLFGDPLLVIKLQEMGYSRLSRIPKAFKMYGEVGTRFIADAVRFPYFDFQCASTQVLADTHSPATGLVEVIINPGILS